MTAHLRAPGGTQTLHDIQAVSLLELYERGGLACFARVGAGKAQPVTEPVHTPDGWRPIGDIRPGDQVTGADGRAVRVLSVHPQGPRPVARVVFSDGSWTRCDWDHLWTARDAHGKVHTRTLRAWSEYGFDRKCGEHRAHKVFIPQTQAVHAPAQLLPLDPYTLGALLGDGAMTQATVRFTTADDDILRALVLPSPVKPRKISYQNSGAATDYALTVGTRGVPNPLARALRSLGLMGRDSSSKFVPSVFMRGSAAQRHALLQGLLDTDGTTAAPGGWVEYSTLSEALALDVVEIVQSLGGTATIGADSANGNARIGLKLPSDYPPFRCARKSKGWRNGQRGPLRAMVSATDDGVAECVCIKVDAADSLYLTRNYIVTHNTIVAALAPTVMAYRGFSRPLYVVPGSLKVKTETEFTALRRHWRVAPQYWLKSFTELGLERNAQILDQLQPDGLIFDEPDVLRSVMKPTASAAAKRIARYIAARRAAGLPLYCVFLGATPERASCLDYLPMVRWALGDGAPCPTDDHELLAWSAYLDGGEDADGGAFVKYFGPVRDREHALDLYYDRVSSTPGVVISDDAFDDVPLTIHVHHVDPCDGEPELAQGFEMLRETWQRPDGWDLVEAADDASPDDVNTWSIWGVARQMAVGFFYRPDPPPPKEWAAARKAWCKYVRQLIEAPGSRYDTERQVRSACERSPRRVLEWERWRDVKDTFKPNPTPVWISRHALDAARAWGAAAPGVIWTDHIAFGKRLAQETGWRFYGQKGLDPAGRSIESEDGTRTVIASRTANQRGRNLQFAFHRNLIMAMPNAACDIEQLIGRTHRQHQSKPVHVDVYSACVEHWNSLQRVETGARKQSRWLAQKWLSLDVVHHGEPPVQSWAWRSKSKAK